MVDLCIHVANLLYLASFLGRDMLWLRILTCGGLVLGLVFFSCQPSPMYGPSAWHVAFLLINGFQIYRLRGERRRLMLTRKQETIGEATFHDLSREELLTLLTHVMYENPQKVRDIEQACHQELNKQEEVFRDIAFSRLSRNELVNLLTRKLWTSIVKMNPARWRRAQQID